MNPLIHPSKYPSIHSCILQTTISIHQFTKINPFIHPPIYPSIHPPIYPSIYPSTHQYIHPSIHPSRQTYKTANRNFGSWLTSLHSSSHPPSYACIHHLSVHEALSIHPSIRPSIHIIRYKTANRK